MVLKEFSILLDKKSRSGYFPGQVLTGQVILDVLSDESVKELRVKIVGKASVEFTDQVWSPSDSTTIARQYKAEEVYISNEVVVISNKVIQNGEKYHPFSFQLPSDIPSSFEWERTKGKVEYGLEAVLKRVAKFDKRCRKTFKVTGLLDLNTVPNCRQELDGKLYEKSKHFLGIHSGTIGFHANFPRRVFVPGDFIHISAKLTNHTKSNVPSITAHLIQNITYRAEGKVKLYSIELCKTKGPSIKAGETEMWAGLILRCPQVPPTHLAGCNLIDIEYFVEVQMKRPFPMRKLKKFFPVTIGNVPLRKEKQHLHHKKKNSMDKCSDLVSSTDSVFLSESNHKEREIKKLEKQHAHKQKMRSSCSPSSLCSTVSWVNRSRVGCDLSVTPTDTLPPTYEEAVTYDEEEIFIKMPETSSEDFDFKSGSYGSSEIEMDCQDDDRIMNNRDGFIPKYVAYSWLIPNYTNSIKRR